MGFFEKLLRGMAGGHHGGQQRNYSGGHHGWGHGYPPHPGDALGRGICQRPSVPSVR